MEFDEYVLSVLSVITLLLGLTYFLSNIFGSVSHVRWSSPWKCPEPPSVSGKIPFVGNAAQIDFNKLHLILHKWSKQYNGVFSFQLYRQKIVVISSQDAIYEALVERGRDFAGRPSMYRTGQGDRHKHSIVWQSYTPKLQLLRKHTQRYLKVYGTGMDLLEERCKPEIETLLQNFREQDSRAFDPSDNIYSAVCNVMILLLLGKRLSHSNSEFKKVVKINSLFNETFGPGVSQRLDFMPWLRLGNDPAKEKLDLALKLRDEFFQKQILEMKINPDSSTDCIVKSLLDYTEIRSSDAQADVTEDTVKEVFTNLLLAGTDTSATALTCLILILLNYPDVQQKLHEEVDRVVRKPRLPSVIDRQAMPYMEAVLLELLRFISHVPLAVPHCTINDTIVQGYHIPADTTVYINLWTLHHDESQWSDPWKFVPERFLDESGELLSPDHTNRRRLMGFGAGRRVCLGETLAKKRLFLFASALIQNFRFEPESKGIVPDMDPRNFKLGLVLHPGHFKVKAIPRNIVNICSDT